LIPFAPNFEEIFFQVYKGGFLKLKRSNKIKAVNTFKNAFLETSLRISRPNQNHMKQSDLGKSLDPTPQASSGHSLQRENKMEKMSHKRCI
jgi:hypothetical protein